MSFQHGNTLSLIWKKLKKGDYTIRPFEVYKRWGLSSDVNDIEHYVGRFGIKIYRALYPENHKYYGNIATLGSSLYHRVFLTQSWDPKLLWYYLDHNFYTEYRKDKYPNVITDYERITYLAESSSVMVIPQKVFGEGIKRGSFDFSVLHPSSSYEYRVYDDSKGNLRDATFNELNFAGTDQLRLYVGFNEKYREYNMRNKPLNYILDMSPYSNDVSIINPKLIKYLPGIPTTDTTQSTGYCGQFTGSYLRVKGDPNLFNFTPREDFAFSFWMKLPEGQQPTNHFFVSLFDKKTIREKNFYTKKTKKVYTEKNLIELVIEENTLPYNPVYPFDIVMGTGINVEGAIPTSSRQFEFNKILFRQSDGVDNARVVKSIEIPTGSWNHIVCQKTGSDLQIWVNATASYSVIVSSSALQNTTNDYEFHIAGDGTREAKFHGELDEIRVYRKSLTENEIVHLHKNTYNEGYAYQTSRIGNIFYKSGIAAVSDPRPKYANAFLGRYGNYDYNGREYGYTGSFRSTTTFYEHEITCKIRKHEFNFTQNSSVLLDKNPNATRVDDYVTSSFFNPYLTTIGLYNEKYDLVAIGKMSAPLEKRDDVDLNVIVRFDI